LSSLAHDRRRGIGLVLVSASLEAGGAERQLADMANYWASDGISLTLVTWSGTHSSDFYSLDPRVCRVRLEGPNGFRGMLAQLRSNMRRVRALRQVLLDRRPDAVLSFIAENNVLTILAAAGLRIRTVVSERAHPAHDTSVPRVWNMLRRCVYRRSDEVVAQTKQASDWISRHYRIRSRVIPNALRELPVPIVQRETMIVAVGRLVRQKGFDLLLRAFAHVVKEFGDWKVVILGEGPDRAELVRLRDSLGLEDRVSFPGQVRDVETWLARAGLVVQPSRFEGFPNAVLEAMGMGAAVVSADCPSGPAEIITDGVDGCLVPVDDVNALAIALQRLLGQPALRARLGTEAMKVRERFHPKRIMAEWDECLLSSGTSSLGGALHREGA
jgi:GalNAc-alpha-(1->4)-GalNAc-alpha-(1->3)-diNAcBac-PP-undecaprenol alpha-1,4-N-acetyl-D-galactosaminyltransferase